MDTDMLPDLASIKKELIASQEVLFSHHLKLEATLGVLLTTNLAEQSASRLYEFICVISDLADKAKNGSEEILNRLMDIET
jgi:hypothetical protein